MIDPNRSPELEVLYEDNHCLAVQKPAGVLTAGDKTGDQSLLELARQYIKRKYDKPGNVFLGVVHRLDRPVSGVVLLARTSKAAARLADQFRSRTVKKVYCAVVEGNPEHARGEVVDYLMKDESKNTVMVVSSAQAGARLAKLAYRVLRRNARYSLLEIIPETGRPHQIRVQLSSRGTPVAGDVKYGAKRIWTRQIALHACSLEFTHPVRQTRLTVQAATPTGWRQFDLEVGGS